MSLYLYTDGNSPGPLYGTLALQLLTHGLGSFSGSNETLDDIAFYKLEYLFDPSDHPTTPFTCSIVKQLSDATETVILSLKEPEYVIPVTNETLNSAGGGAATDYDGSGAVVFWDYTNCHGDGRWSKSPAGKNIVLEVDSVLLHELMHCFYKIVMGHPIVDSPGSEEFAVAQTNIHRAEVGQELRATGAPVGCGDPPPQTIWEWFQKYLLKFTSFTNVLGGGKW